MVRFGTGGIRISTPNTALNNQSRGADPWEAVLSKAEASDPPIEVLGITDYFSIDTHNANLVVNTDADQVIVASCGRHRPGQLPQISHECGGLETPAIRRRVCEILEGGERAFKERARRLRVAL